jgi:hypothetical protein
MKDRRNTISINKWVKESVHRQQCNLIRTMTSSGMLYHVALVRTDVSEELSASFIRVTRIGELGTKLAVTSNRRTLHPDEGGAKFLRNVGFTRATRRNIPEDAILHSHRRKNLKSYIIS